MSSKQQIDAISAPIQLPCGLSMPNRLVKAAMEEMLGPLGGGDPQPEHFVIYDQWSQGGWGMILTGNVMVSSSHLGTPLDVIVPASDASTYQTSITAFKAWSESAHAAGSAPVIMQLCHTGRQSMRGSGRSVLTASKSASAIALNANKDIVTKVMSRAMFGEPKEMTLRDINNVVEEFVQGARVASESGFEGVQLHASHGYLLSQFLSPNTNVRKDLYGGSALNRMKIVFQIIDAIRDEFPVSSGFCVGIKLNSSDYIKGGLTEKDALDNVKWLAEHGGLDFIEISGGTYENAEMSKPDVEHVGKPTSSTYARESFFTSFASTARSLVQSLPSASLPTPAPLILVTGGFRTRGGMASALLSSATDLVGIGRPACIDTALPLTIMNPRLSDEEARAPKYKIKGTAFAGYLPLASLLLPGVSTLWHTLMMTQIARREKPDVELPLLQGMWILWFRSFFMKNIPSAVIACAVLFASLRVLVSLV